MPPLGLLLLLAAAEAANFTVAGGQIFTPGFAVVDAPQPGTPLGGDTLEVALDVTADGAVPLPDELAADSPSRLHNITLFLSSYDAQHNFTVSNGTAAAANASLGPVLALEPGSTVKHVRWVWPDCLVGSGGSAPRGVYNISIRQSFRLNGVEHYTILDLPIAVTNSIDRASAAAPDGVRPACAALDNPLLSPDQINASAANAGVGVLFAPGDATQVAVDLAATSSGDGLGPLKPEAGPQDGLGSAAGRTTAPAHILALVASIAAVLVFLPL